MPVHISPPAKAQSRELAAPTQEPETRLSPGRLALLIAVVACCFGPYVSSGVRTEQVALLATLAVGIFLWGTSLRLNAYGRTIIAVSLAMAFVATAVTLTAAVPIYTTRLPISGLENLLLPAMAIMAGLVLVENREQTRQALQVVYMVILVGLSINLVLQLMQSQGTILSLSAWWTGEEGRTIAQSAGAGGRFTGIFNQPFEGGLIYAIGLILWYQVGSRRLVAAIPTLLILLLGGFLLSSKVFFLGLAVVVGAFLIDLARRRRAFGGIIMAVLGVLALIQFSGALQVDFLARYSRGEQFLATITGGRYGSTSVTGDFVSQMLSESPLYGFGLTGFPVPYDSAWMEWLSTGGVIGLLLGLSMLAALVLAATQKSASPRPLSTMVCLLTLGACVGGPALTANRASLLLWLVLTWALLARDRTVPAVQSPQARRLGAKGVRPVLAAP